MCPACMTTVALAIAGAASTGGLGALAATKLRTRIGAEARDAKPQSEETGPCRTTES